MIMSSDVKYGLNQAIYSIETTSFVRNESLLNLGSLTNKVFRLIQCPILKMEPLILNTLWKKSLLIKLNYLEVMVAQDQQEGVGLSVRLDSHSTIFQRGIFSRKVRGLHFQVVMVNDFPSGHKPTVDSTKVITSPLRNLG